MEAGGLFSCSEGEPVVVFYDNNYTHRHPGTCNPAEFVMNPPQINTTHLIH